MKLAGLTSATEPDFGPGLGATPGRSVRIAEAPRFDDLVTRSMTIGDAFAERPFSLTENATWSDPVALNSSLLSEPPCSIAPAIRETYGRILSARPGRFHAHA